MRKLNERGITLISLIVTVIVMIILAFVTTNMFIGDHGIFRRTEEAANLYKNAVDKENHSLNEIDKEYDRIINNKPAGEIKFAINFIDINEGENVKGNAIVNLYSDSECNNLLKQIKISPSDASDEYSYRTEEALESGTYYVRLEQAPENYSMYGDDIVKKEVKAGANFTTWNLFVMSSVLPSYGHNINLSKTNEVPKEGYDDRLIEFEFENRVGNPSLQEEVDLDNGIEIYEIAKYDETTNKYTYINGMENYNLPELSSVDVQEIYALASLGVDYKKSYIAKMINEAINQEVEKGTIEQIYNNEGSGNGVYFIRPKEEVYGNKYKYRFEPFILVPAIEESQTGNKYSHFKMEMLWKYERRYGTVEIVNNLEEYNEHLKEVIVAYEITAEDEGEMVYSDVVVEKMKAQGVTSTLVENIPAGSNVTIKNIYCSLGCAIVTDEIMTTEVLPDDIVGVDFGYGMTIMGGASNKHGKAYVSIKNKYDKANSTWKLYNGDSYASSLNMNMRTENRKVVLSIKNTDAKDCFVRLKVLSKEQIGSNEALVAGWRIDYDDYYYYDSVLQNNEATKELEFTIPEEEKDFNVIIVVESVVPYYSVEDGTAYADWDSVEEGGAE